MNAECHWCRRVPPTRNLGYYTRWGFLEAGHCDTCITLIALGVALNNDAGGFQLDGGGIARKELINMSGYLRLDNEDQLPPPDEYPVGGFARIGDTFYILRGLSGKWEALDHVPQLYLDELEDEFDEFDDDDEFVFDEDDDDEFVFGDDDDEEDDEYVFD